MDDRRAAGAWAVGAAWALATLAAAPDGLASQRAGGEPLVTDRPDFTESAVAVAPGRAQLEAGYTFTRDGETRLHDVGEALLRVGVVPAVELRAGLSSFSVRDRDGRAAETGLRDASLGVKLALAEPSAPAAPRVALLAGTTLPTGDDTFGTDGVRPGATLALGWELPGRFGLGANGGYTYGKSGGTRFDEVTASGALSYAVSDAVGVYGEYFALVRDDGGPDDENFLDAGLTYLLGPDLQLDARMGLGLDGPEPDYFAGVGVSVRR